MGTTFAPLTEHEEKIAKEIVSAAYIVHKALGPGLFEHIYEVCFCQELAKKGISFRQQVTVPLVYDGIKFDENVLSFDSLCLGAFVAEG